jgi:N-acetylglucosamine-6-sulfatase
VYLIVVLLFSLSPIRVLPQAPAPGTPPGRGGPEQRGPAGPAAPANVAFHNERNDMRHQGFVDIAKKGNIDLLFVGDSITDWFYWPRGNGEATGGKVWEANFAPLKPANFAIAGDTTQGVLWRMQNGELEGFKAKLIVLMLGTNNINRNPNDEIAEGDRLIIEEFRKHQPQAKVLLLGIFPRNMDAASPLRIAVKDINGKLAKLADNKQIFYKDIGEKFLTTDGTLTTEIMGDGLHPTAKGYQIWADAIIGDVKSLMK